MTAWRLAKRTLIVFILLWGMLALLARLATPLLQHAREPVADWLSQQIGQSVQIEKLSAHWYGLGPRLRLKAVRIGEGETALLLEHALLELRPDGLFSQQPTESLRLTLSGMELKLLREADGHVHVAGLPGITEPTQTDQSAPVSLPGQLRLSNTRIVWEDRLVNARPLHIDDLYLDLKRSGNHLRLAAELDSPQGHAHFIANIDGRLTRDDWSGNSYLRVQGMHLANLLSPYLPEHYRIDGGKLDLELWQYWQHARALDSRGHLALRDVALGGQDTSIPSVRFDKIAADLQFDRQDTQQWQLQLDKTEVVGAGASPWPSGRIVVRARSQEHNPPSIDIAIEHIILDQLAELAQIRPVEGGWQAALQQLRPRGWLHHVRVHVPSDRQAWSASARFDDLAISPWRKVPGLRHLSGRLAASAQHSMLSLHTREAPLDYSALFREPLHLNRLHGDIHFSRDHESWSLISEQLDLDTPDLKSTSRLYVRKEQDQPAHLELLSAAHDADVSATSKYLPASIMNPNLVNFLDRSLSSGRGEQVGVIFKGPLDTFPYDEERNGVFEVVAITRDTPLNYREGWPPLKDLSARLEFHEQSMEIELLEGRIYNTPIKRLSARIDDLWPTTPLRISGEIQGPLEDQVAVLKEDALSPKFGHIAEALSVQGDAQLSLDFEVPLSPGDKYRLDGRLQFQDAQLSLPEWDLKIDRIHGELGITLDHLEASGLSGRTMGAPVTVSVIPQGDGSTRVRAQARLSDQAIEEQLPQLPPDIASGSSDFIIDLDIPGVSAGDNAPTWLTVASNLRGMRIDLPQPLGKSPGQTRRISVQIPVAGKPNPTRLSYAEQLSAVIGPHGKRADIRLGGGSARLSGEQGYRIRGELDKLDLAAWQTALAKLPQSNPADSPDWQADILVGQLSADALSLDDASLALQKNSEAISGRIDSRQLRGNFRYPLTSGEPLQIRLAKAHLRFDAEAESLPQPPEPAREPDPRKLPPLQLACDDLKLNQADLGSLLLTTKPSPLGMQIVALKLSGGEASVQASGNWGWRDQAQSTDLAGNFETNKFGGLLERLGYPRHMHGAPAKASFNLNWPGHPGQIHKASLGGTLNMNIGAGRLAQVAPGITRVIGLLNVDALTRRIKLDFGDLLKKGYSFDSIKGGFRFEKGQTNTSDLLIQGPSGRIEIGGRIGLVERDFDLLVHVTPNLDATLPIATTIAGGPVAGVATLIAQQLISDEVDRINRFDYSVRGSWDEPELIPLDSGGGLSRLVNTLRGEKTEAKTAEQEGLIKPQEPTKPNPIKQLLKAIPEGLKKLPGATREPAPPPLPASE